MYEVPAREGGDITAADMVDPDLGTSEIADFYANSTIFLTGATGFLGKMCLEKLLRDCYDLKRIYVLVRPKKGKDIQTRFREIFEGPNMEPLKRKRPDFDSKVALVSGDCALPELGLSDEDRERLLRETNCVLHCAATVRFDEKLRLSAVINVKTVMDLIRLAKQMKDLKSLVYVSTAFSNCVRQRIDDVFYPPPMTAEKLLSLLDALDDAKLEKITPIILGEHPNTYTFTKAVAEDVIAKERKGLPVGVIRPSIVIGSVREPVAGWVDNFYGATGILVGAALGVLRSLHGRRDCVADMVPADYVVNATLATAWMVASTKTINENRERSEETDQDIAFLDAPIVNYVSSPESAITWDLFTKLSEKHARRVPTPLLVWAYCFALRSNKLHHLVAVFFLHTVPAYIVDFVSICLGKEPILVKGYKKIYKFGEVVSYFSYRQWHFTNNKTRAMLNKMSARDRELFQFDLKNFNWDEYFPTYIKGARCYLLKDPLSTLPEGRVRYYKLLVAHYTLMTVLFLVLCKILAWIFGLPFLF